MLLVAGDHRRFIYYSVWYMQHNADKRREKKRKDIVDEMEIFI